MQSWGHRWLGPTGRGLGEGGAWEWLGGEDVLGRWRAQVKEMGSVTEDSQKPCVVNPGVRHQCAMGEHVLELALKAELIGKSAVIFLCVSSVTHHMEVPTSRWHRKSPGLGVRRPESWVSWDP